LTEDDGYEFTSIRVVLDIENAVISQLHSKTRYEGKINLEIPSTTSMNIGNNFEENSRAVVLFSRSVGKDTTAAATLVVV